MEQSKAITKLMEVADLAAMVEDMMSPTMMSHLSPGSWAGMRVTMRNIRESLVACHDSLASDVVARARLSQPAESMAKTAAPSGSLASRVELQREPARAQSINLTSPASASGEGAKSRDLRSTLEKALTTAS